MIAMGLLKLGIGLFILFLFQTVAKLNVSDDVLFLGLSVLLSAFVLHETVDDRTYLVEEEEEHE